MKYIIAAAFLFTLATPASAEDRCDSKLRPPVPQGCNPTDIMCVCDDDIKGVCHWVLTCP
jgi:hypothetical protein